MRVYILLLALLLCCQLNAQDKIYFLDGNTKKCKIESIDSEYLSVVNSDGEEETISKLIVSLIEFSNGSIEIINIPEKDIVNDPVKREIMNELPGSRDYKNNYVSINTIALCNADISGFYEYIPKGKPFGFGVMGAYNFNVNTTLQNVFITVLNNPKKKYDVGAIINFYPSDYSEDLKISFGLMMKYTSFSFERSYADTTGTGGTGTSVTYKPATGSQLATMFTVGSQMFIDDHFFLKAFGGIGGFKLKGDYKYEYNKTLNGVGATREVNFLPKIYLGVNLGFNF